MKTRKLSANDKRVINLFLANEGNPGKTAKALGLSRTTFWRMQQNNPELGQAMQDAWEDRLDNIEQAAVKMAEGIPKMEPVEVFDKNGKSLGMVMQQTGWHQPPDARFAKMVLDARAKSRGYGKMDIDLGTQEGVELLITNTVVRRGEVRQIEGRAEVVPE